MKPILDEMIERWRRIGLQVMLLNDEESKAGEWDIAYRTIVMAEPLIELWPFLTSAILHESSICNCYPVGFVSN